jgi:hypothetical protein
METTDWTYGLPTNEEDDKASNILYALFAERFPKLSSEYIELYRFIQEQIVWEFLELDEQRDEMTLKEQEEQLQKIVNAFLPLFGNNCNICSKIRDQKCKRVISESLYAYASS